MLLKIKEDGIYEVTEFHNIHGEVSKTKEDIVIDKEAFIMAYNTWIRSNNEWERKLP